MVLPAGDNCPPLSINLCLSDYLERTKPLRDYYEKAEGEPPVNLFISNCKPYQCVSSSTLAKWLLIAMDKAGIDTTRFKAHSSRSSSTSAMRNKGCSLAQVLKKGFWSDRSRTFCIYYDRSGCQPAA